MTQFVVVPWIASDVVGNFPEIADLEAPYVISFGVAIIGFQLALFAVWRMLTLSSQGASATRRITSWANVMVGGISFMSLISAGVFIHAMAFQNIGGPAMLIALIGLIAVVAMSVLSKSTIVRKVSTNNHGVYSNPLNA